MGSSAIDCMVTDLQRAGLAKVRHLHVLHVGNPIGQYINVPVVSSKIAAYGYAWVLIKMYASRGGRLHCCLPSHLSDGISSRVTYMPNALRAGV